MRISDWSSDVCSSDLRLGGHLLGLLGRIDAVLQGGAQHVAETAGRSRLPGTRCLGDGKALEGVAYTQVSHDSELLPRPSVPQQVDRTADHLPGGIDDRS